MQELLFNSHILVGMHVAVLITLGFTLIKGSYERKFYKTFISQVVTPGMTQHEKALVLLHSTYAILQPRKEIFERDIKRSVGERFFHSSLIALTEGWSCGDFASVLGRSLKTAGFDIRIAQMKVRGTFGGHILIEAKVDDQWVVFDPLHDLAFVNRDGTLASFKEVSNNWEYFKEQAEKQVEKQALSRYPSYPSYIKYEGVRYTNWQKVPLIMPLVKRLLGFVLGDGVEEISLRVYFLDIYKIYTIALFVLYIAIAGLTIVAM